MRLSEKLPTGSISRVSPIRGERPRRLLSSRFVKPHAFLIAHPEYRLADDESRLFGEIVTRRESREPFSIHHGQTRNFGGLNSPSLPAFSYRDPRPKCSLKRRSNICNIREHPTFCRSWVRIGLHLSVHPALVTNRHGDRNGYFTRRPQNRAKKRNPAPRQ